MMRGNTLHHSYRKEDATVPISALCTALAIIVAAGCVLVTLQSSQSARHAPDAAAEVPAPASTALAAASAVTTATEVPVATSIAAVDSTPASPAAAIAAPTELPAVITPGQVGSYWHHKQQQATQRSRFGSKRDTTPALLHHWRTVFGTSQGGTPVGAHVLLPLSGNSPDAAYLLARGAHVLGIEIVPAAARESVLFAVDEDAVGMRAAAVTAAGYASSSGSARSSSSSSGGSDGVCEVELSVPAEHAAAAACVAGADAYALQGFDTLSVLSPCADTSASAADAAWSGSSGPALSARRGAATPTTTAPVGSYSVIVGDVFAVLPLLLACEARANDISQAAWPLCLLLPPADERSSSARPWDAILDVFALSAMPPQVRGAYTQLLSSAACGAAAASPTPHNCSKLFLVGPVTPADDKLCNTSATMAGMYAPPYSVHGSLLQRLLAGDSDATQAREGEGEETKAATHRTDCWLLQRLDRGGVEPNLAPSHLGAVFGCSMSGRAGGTKVGAYLVTAAISM